MSISIGGSPPSRNMLGAGCEQPVDAPVARATDAESKPRPCCEGKQDEFMSCIPAKYCRGKSGLSRVELALLAYVIEHPEPWQQGSRSEIADDCECAANSVPRAARRLILLELIKTVPGGGARNTIYSLGRNMQVTESDNTRSADVTRNVEDTTSVTSELRAASSDAQTETTTTDMVVTTLRGGRNIPPPHPPINTSSNSEGNSEHTEPSLNRGPGDLFGGAKPARKSRRKTKSIATDQTMPKEPSARMLSDATNAGLVNGSRTDAFEAWRDWHIAKGSEIADHEASFRMWLRNGKKFAAAKTAKGGGDKRPIALGGGQVGYAKRHQPTMRAARA